MTSIVNTVIITCSIIALKMVRSLGQRFDEVWNVVCKVCKNFVFYFIGFRLCIWCKCSNEY